MIPQATLCLDWIWITHSRSICSIYSKYRTRIPCWMCWISPHVHIVTTTFVAVIECTLFVALQKKTHVRWFPIHYKLARIQRTTNGKPTPVWTSSFLTSFQHVHSSFKHQRFFSWSQPWPKREKRKEQEQEGGGEEAEKMSVYTCWKEEYSTSWWR